MFGSKVASHAPSKPTGLERDVYFSATSHGSLPSLSSDRLVPAPSPVDSLAHQPLGVPANLTNIQPQLTPMGASQPRVPYPPSAPVLTPALNASSVSSAPQSTIHAVEHDDLLKPTYNWMSQQVRTSTNARVAYLRDIMANENMPKTAQHAAMRELVAICTHVHDARTKAYFSPRFSITPWMLIPSRYMFKIHVSMPIIYDAVIAQRHLPSHHPDVIKANETLQKAHQLFQGSSRDYMGRLLNKMIKRAQEAKVPYEAIPGWLEQCNKEHLPIATNENVEGEPEQSKGESSPLPQRKDY
jgi:hypothetical protein